MNKSEIELRKLINIGIVLTLIILGAAGISGFTNQDNFILIFPGLIWGLVFPPLIHKIGKYRILSLKRFIGLVLAMHIPFSTMIYLVFIDLFTVSNLLLIVSSMALFGGITSLIIDLKWKSTTSL